MEKKLISTIFLLAIASFSWLWSYAQVDRPNMVIFIGDDLGVSDIGPYGNTNVRTPHLDAFAAESMLFRQAFAAAPTCAPSRMSLYTGQYPLRHGAIANQMGVYSHVSSIVQYFKPLGYKVAIAGKLHVGPQEVFDFDHIAGTNAREPGTEGLKGMFGDLVLAPVGEWLSKQRPDTPFVLIVADHSPHVTWPLNPTYQPEDVAVSPQLIDTEQTRALMTRYYTDISKMDANLGRLLSMVEENEHRNTVVVFTADQGPQWPFGKWTLYDYGIQAPLIIRWPGHIQANSISDALVSHVDVVPTLLEIANGGAVDSIDGRSFYPVLKDAQNPHRQTVYASHSGDKVNNRSAIRMLRTTEYKYILNLTSADDQGRSNPNNVNVKQTPDDWLAAAYQDDKAAATMWRLTHQPDEELYAVQQDPHELRNLVYSEDHREILQWFREQMKSIRIQQGDTGDRWKTDLNQIPQTVDGTKSIAPYSF